MKYFNEQDLLNMGVDWDALVNTVKQAVLCRKNGDTVQPLKPYLKFGDPHNRIIAMPAYIGGSTNSAGLKWISSFPNNIHEGMSRAHSIVILNSTRTGKPLAMFNSSFLSVLRTVAVSGLMMSYFIKARPIVQSTLGILGVGPIGESHYRFMKNIYGDRFSNILIYDRLTSRMEQMLEKTQDSKIQMATDWRDVYMKSDVLITCTNTSKPYINLAPKKGSLHLNISLRDYHDSVYPYFKEGIIVDDWEEVCREGTTIERYYRNQGLRHDDVTSLEEIVTGGLLKSCSTNTPIMFNPMGMAIFDISIANYYFTLSQTSGHGIELPD